VSVGDARSVLGLQCAQVLAAASPLILALALGVVFGLCALFPAPEQAISTLNRFCLYLAFPALIFASVYEAQLDVSDAWGLVLATVLPTLAALLILGLSTRRMRPEARAAMGLGGCLGNIAYLGIPLSTTLVGPEMLGLASVVAALHIVVTIPLGTWTLLRWGGVGAETDPDGEQPRAPLSRLLRQPLVWAPVSALVARAVVPAGWVEPVLAPAKWFGAAASPVALFMIGLYLYVHRRELLHLGWSDAGLIAAKLLLLPSLALLCLWALRPIAGLGLEADAAKVVFIQAATPTAITTFALAEAYGIGREAMARGIVGSTLLFMVLFPLFAPRVLDLL